MELPHGKLKVMTTTDLTRLTVTTEMVAILPPVNPDGDIPLRVFDNQTHRVYEFMLAGRHRGYLRPVVQSRGWRVFVKDRGIEVGDVIGLWEEENPTYLTQYRIVLFKPDLFPLHPELHLV